MILKAMNSNSDFYIALLHYRSIPKDGVSPSEILMSRKLRTTLPVRKEYLSPNTVNKSNRQKLVKRNKCRMSKYYNNCAKSLTDLCLVFKKSPQSNSFKAQL